MSQTLLSLVVLLAALAPGLVRAEDSAAVLKACQSEAARGQYATPEQAAQAFKTCLEELRATPIDAPYEHRYDFQSGTRLGIVRPSSQQQSDPAAVIAKITPVRNQEARGTCAIFAATAEVEAMLAINKCKDPHFNRETLDLSEEWLEYLAMRNRSSDGSSSYTNFSLYMKYGFLDETDWPYLGETWTAADLGRADIAKACGTPTGPQAACLLGHRDPELISDPEVATKDPQLAELVTKAKANAPALANAQRDFFVRDEDEVKELLRQGIPVVLEVDFYYGAWNHRLGPSYGIQRDGDAFARGEVGYPQNQAHAQAGEPQLDSVDFTQSNAHREGHAILLVGYDDNEVIHTAQTLSDGTTAKLDYTGVYYFKNSWGTNIFGTQTTVPTKQADGTFAPVVHEGFGKITERYAHDFGQFYKFPLPADPGCGSAAN